MLQALSILVGFASVGVAGWIGLATDRRRRLAERQDDAFRQLIGAIAKSAQRDRAPELQTQALVELAQAKALLLATCSEDSASHLAQAAASGFATDNDAVQDALIALLNGIRTEARRPAISSSILRPTLFGSGKPT